MKSRFLAALFAGLIFAISAAPAAAAYPTKAVELVVPNPPGGATDLSARILAKALQEKWKVPVRVVNLPGGATAVAVDDIMRAPKDGTRLLIDGLSASSLLGLVVKDLPYKVTDRSFISYTTRLPQVLAVPADSPHKSLADVIAALKKDSKSVTWSSLGGTGVSDLLFFRLFRMAGVHASDTRAVVSRGGSEVATQLAGGHIMLGAASPSSLQPFIASGKIRAVAVFANERSKLMPSVPSTTELGFPEAATVQWNGISGPPGLSPEVARTVHAAVQEALADPQVIAGFERIGLDPFPSRFGAMAADVEAEMKTLDVLLKSSKP